MRLAGPLRQHATPRLANVAVLAASITGCAPAPTPPAPHPAPAPMPAPLPVAPAEVSHPVEGRIDARGAGMLWYRVAGTAADTVLVPLGAYLRDALTPLSSSHTLVFYDPRHRGRSDASADTTLSTFDGDVDDMEAVRRQLGISRVSIIGFSYFGAVAAAYAERYPDRVGHLVLLSPIEPTDSLERAYDPPERRTRVDTTRARALLKLRAIGRDTSDPVSYCLAYWQVNAPLFVGDLAHAARLNPTWCQLPNEAPRSMGDHVARTMRSLGTRRDFSPRASHLTVPTLIVNGEQDLVASPAGAAAWARLISRARQVAVPGAGHFVFLEERDAVVRAIDRFLRDLAPS